MEQSTEKRSHEDEDSTINSKKKKTVSTNRYLTYDILRIVFKYLNGMELLKAATVCRFWLEVANDEKRTRGGFTYLMQNFKRCIKHFRAQIIKKLQVKPVLGLFFRAPCVPYNKQDCHCKILPTSCDIITLSTYGVVIDNKEMKNGFENLVCAFLPDMPNVRIKTVTVALLKEQSYNQLTEQYYSQVRAALSKLRSSNFKCLLLFCNQRGRRPARTIAEELKISNRAVKPSVWGGVVYDLRICNSKNVEHDRCAENAFCIGVTISGAVDTWSVVIDPTYSTKELVEQKLMSFKKHVSLKKHSMGFMFACCERGVNMFNESNVESSLFKKLFPQVPLVGCFGDGEFGETTIPNESSKKEKKVLYNERSTIFLIITYG